MSKHEKDEAQAVFKGKIFTVLQWEQTQFDGSKKTFESIPRPDTAYILPVLADKRLLLVEDEQPHRDVVITIPRGRVESTETAQEAAVRELKEETGLIAQDIRLWGSYQPWGKIAWRVSFFIGRNITDTAEKQLEAGEKIAPHPVSFEEFVELASSGALQDPWLQITLLQAKLDPQKMETFKKLLYD